MAKQPYFDSRHLPDPKNEYVAWVDVMGVKAVMARTLQATANFVLKLHVAMLEAPRQGVRLYPVMDGAYVTSPTQDAMTDFLRDVYARLAGVFVSAGSPLYQCVIKGALSYGPVIHGADLPSAASYTLDNNPEYRGSILLGMPMVQAVQSELKAPPFGVFVHESARSFAPPGARPFNNVWWSWSVPNHRRLASDLRAELGKYYDWCEARASMIEYEPDRIRSHRRMVAEYFVDA